MPFLVTAVFYTIYSSMTKVWKTLIWNYTLRIKCYFKASSNDHLISLFKLCEWDSLLNSAFNDFRRNKCLKLMLQSNPHLVNGLVSSNLFTKLGFFTILKVTKCFNINLVSLESFTKQGFFTILTFTKSRFDCNYLCP